MLYSLFPWLNTYLNPVATLVIAFAVTFLFIKLLKDKLPTDLGRAFAVNGEKSKGKARGAGIVFISVFSVLDILLVPTFSDLFYENLIYLVLIWLACLSGFLDDASRAPWGEYKKALIDLVISVGIAVTFVTYNGSSIYFPLVGESLRIPTALYIVLAALLVWASINVVNCTDGVDGLCGTLSVFSILGFVMIALNINPSPIHSLPPIYSSILMIGCIGAYLMFNSSPSSLLMGDAGSRAIGVFLALLALQTRCPLSFLPLCLIFIIDGGLGLIKVALLRFLKIKILKNTRTPIHDHVRKNHGWSDTQTVARFVIIQVLVSILYLCYLH